MSQQSRTAQTADMHQENGLVQRMDRLERQNRGLKLALGAVAMGTVLMSFTPAALVCKTVWAERFILSDSSGKQRLEIDAYRSGEPTFTVKDKHGKVLASTKAKDLADFRAGAKAKSDGDKGKSKKKAKSSID